MFDVRAKPRNLTRLLDINKDREYAKILADDHVRALRDGRVVGVENVINTLFGPIALQYCRRDIMDLLIVAVHTKHEVCVHILAELAQ
jgi:hypothetical protein